MACPLCHAPYLAVLRRLKTDAVLTWRIVSEGSLGLVSLPSTWLSPWLLFGSLSKPPRAGAGLLCSPLCAVWAPSSKPPAWHRGRGAQAVPSWDIGDDGPSVGQSFPVWRECWARCWRTRWHLQGRVMAGGAEEEGKVHGHSWRGPSDVHLREAVQAPRTSTV